MIVALSQSGRGTKELSDEYDLNASMISRWHREYNSKSGDLTKKSGLSVEEKELRILRKALKEVQLERDILKKAISIFSRSGR
jgi:transposase